MKESFLLFKGISLFLACGVPEIPNGKLFSVNDTEFTAYCNKDYTPEAVTLYCHSNGTWIQEDGCTYKYGMYLVFFY